MNSEGNIFSADRFRRYFALYLASSRKNLLALAGGTALVVLIIMVFPELVSNFSSYKNLSYNAMHYPVKSDPMWNTILPVLCFTAAIYLTITGSLLFSSMKDKTGRMRTLTLPASNLEKALTGFLVYIVGGLLLFFISVFVGDLVRVALVKMFAFNPHLGKLLPYTRIFTERPEVILVVEALMAVMLFFQSLYALGGIYWYRFSYVKTLVYLYVLQFVCIIAGVLSYAIFFSNARPELRHQEFFENLFTNHIAVVGWSLAAFTVVVLVGIYSLAYWRFRQSDLVHRW